MRKSTLDCIKNLKHRTRPKPKQGQHSWKGHQPLLFAKTDTDIRGYNEWKSDGVGVTRKNYGRYGHPNTSKFPKGELKNAAASRTPAKKGS